MGRRKDHKKEMNHLKRKLDRKRKKMHKKGLTVGETAHLKTAKQIIQEALESGLRDQVLVKQEVKDVKRYPLMAQAAYVGLVEVLINLLEVGEDPNVQTMDGSTPLLIAVDKCHSHLVEFLLEKGADPKICRQDGTDALMMAMSRGDLKTFDILWKHVGEKEINHSNLKGDTLLSIAVEMDSSEMVKFLFGIEGIDINKQRVDGLSPLMIAAMRGNCNLVELLIAAGSNIMLEEVRGAIALCLAISTKHRHVIEKLYMNMDEKIKSHYAQSRIQLLVEPRETYSDFVTFYKDILLMVFLEMKQNMVDGVLLLHRHNLFGSLICCASRCIQHTELLHIIFHLSAYLMYNPEEDKYIIQELVNDFVRAEGPDLSFKILTGEFSGCCRELKLAAFLPIHPICLMESGKLWLKTNFIQLYPYVSEFNSHKSKIQYYIDGAEEKAKVIFTRFQLVMREIIEKDVDLLKQLNSKKAKPNIDKNLTLKNQEDENKHTLVVNSEISSTVQDQNNQSTSITNVQCTSVLTNHDPGQSAVDSQNTSDMTAFTGYAAALKKNLNVKSKILSTKATTLGFVPINLRQLHNCLSHLNFKKEVAMKPIDSTSKLPSAKRIENVTKPSPLEFGWSEEMRTNLTWDQLPDLPTKWPAISIPPLSTSDLKTKYLTKELNRLDTTLNERNYSGCDPISTEECSIESKDQTTGFEQLPAIDSEELSRDTSNYDISSFYSISANESLENFSLRNIFKMFKGIENCVLDIDILRRPRDIKKQIEFIYTMLFKMQSVVKPDDILVFIIQQYLISCTSNLELPTNVSKKKAFCDMKCDGNSHGCSRELNFEETSKMDTPEKVSIRYMDQFPELESPMEENDIFHSSNRWNASCKTSTPKKAHHNHTVNKDEKTSCKQKTRSRASTLPANVFLKGSDSLKWWHENSNIVRGDLCNVIDDTNLVLSSIKYFATVTAAEYANKDFQKSEYAVRSLLDLHNCETERKNRNFPNFRLFLHHSFHVNEPVPPVSEMRPSCDYFNLKLERNSIWYERFLNLKDLMCYFTVDWIAATTEVLFYSSHLYYALRQGHFVGTYMGIFSRSIPVVVKCIDVFTLHDEGLRLIKRIRRQGIHPDTLTRYHKVGFCKVKLRVCVITEFCEFNLTEYLERQQEVPLTPEGEIFDAKLLITQLIEAIIYLHSLTKPIIHGHLKPSNVLIDRNYRLKVADYYQMNVLLPVYGLQVVNVIRSPISSLSWRPQELINANSIEEAMESYTKASDVQLVGMLIYYIFSVARHPFGDSDKRCQRNIQVGRLCLNAKPAHLEGRDLVTEMVRHMPYKRLEITKAVRHPYFWIPERKFQFLLAVEKKLDFLTREPHDVCEMLKQSCLESRDWVFYLREDIHEFMTKKRTYENNFVDHLHFAADLQGIFCHLPSHLKEFVKTPSQYFLYTYPTIFMSVYHVLRKDRLLQRQMALNTFFYNP